MANYEYFFPSIYRRREIKPAAMSAKENGKGSDLKNLLSIIIWMQAIFFMTGF